MGERHAQARIWGVQVLAAALGFALTVAGCTAPRSNVPATRESGASVEISKRGPGMHRQPLDALKLPVPRTFDLAHVDPTHFATALEKDPVRIFEFVRDYIAFEAYAGALRGPRGTLMAMAGNSIDRALLLGSLLEHAGHRIRYARGTLPEGDARDLVTSMWGKPPVQPPQAGDDPPPALKTASETLLATVSREYKMIRDQLKNRSFAGAGEPAPTVNQLTEQAREHYWVQWMKDGGWTDLDPSFADAAPGQTYAQRADTVDVLPETLYHRIAIRLRIEENDNGTVSNRQILTFEAKAADLSGVDVIFGHQPENWQGPPKSLADALASAIADTGRVKPVLLMGQQVVMGDVFQSKIKTGGLGGIPFLLGGAGPVATAEYLDIDFASPGGHRETVTREIFDIVGQARRREGRNLTAEEARVRATEAKAVDVTQGIFSLLFTTGRLEWDHFSDVIEDAPSDEGENVDIDAVLRAINVTFVAASDALLRQVGRSDRAIVRFYPDSPRVIISELSGLAGKPPRVALDLRRDHVRAVAIGLNAEDVVAAHIFRGVVEGTLERVLLEYAMADAPEGLLKPVISTSGLLEQAQAERVPLLLLPDQDARLDDKLPEDSRARLREEASRGNLTLVPQRAILVAGAARLAWWRIHPQSGETTAVTDEGLHQVVVEYQVHQDEQTGQTTVTVTRVFPNGRVRYFRTTHWNLRDPRLWRRFLRYTRLLDQAMGRGPFLH